MRERVASHGGGKGKKFLPANMYKNQHRPPLRSQRLLIASSVSNGVQHGFPPMGASSRMRDETPGKLSVVLRFLSFSSSSFFLEAGEGSEEERSRTHGIGKIGGVDYRVRAASGFLFRT